MRQTVFVALVLGLVLVLVLLLAEPVQDGDVWTPQTVAPPVTTTAAP